MLEDARQFNREHNITGVLLFSGEQFFQYIEGDRDALTDAMQRITAAAAHSNIKVLFDGEPLQRHFDDWHMGFTSAPTSEIQTLAQADWQLNFPHTREDADLCEGISLITLHWSKWVAGMR